MTTWISVGDNQENNMKHINSFVRGMFVVGLFCAPMAANAGGTLTMAKKMDWVNAKKIKAAIVTECGLPERLSDFIKKYNKTYDKINQVNSIKGAKGDVLDVRLVDATGYYRGGGFVPSAGGRNYLEARGKLIRNGKVVGSFEVARGTSRGGRVCKTLAHISKSLGRDIAEWLAKPRKNAKLGEKK